MYFIERIVVNGEDICSIRLYLYKDTFLITYGMESSYVNVGEVTFYLRNAQTGELIQTLYPNNYKIVDAVIKDNYIQYVRIPVEAQPLVKLLKYDKSEKTKVLGFPNFRGIVEGTPQVIYNGNYIISVYEYMLNFICRKNIKMIDTFSLYTTTSKNGKYTVYHYKITNQKQLDTYRAKLSFMNGGTGFCV